MMGGFRFRVVGVSYFLACCVPDVASIPCNCRSNATHIAWPNTEHQHGNHSTARSSNSAPARTGIHIHTGTPITAATRSMASISIESTSNANGCCWYQERHEAERDALAYLRKNVMPFDVPNMETLGLSNGGSNEPDGLMDGLIGPTVSLALDAKVKYTWADNVPQSIYFEYVLNYANVNEPRTNWRPLLTSAIEPILQDLVRSKKNLQVNDVVRAVNANLWKVLGREEESIIFKSGQTPLIFDPMSVIAFGYCSCTGTAILLTNALRAAGVPTRVVGTPAWGGKRESGNHNWVEVYHSGTWDFLEPSTPTDPAADIVINPDDLERDPCKRWFCNPSKNYGRTATRVYAARLDRKRSDTYCPLAWEWNSTDVPGEDRTDYYMDKCSCSGSKNE